MRRHAHALGLVSPGRFFHAGNRAQAPPNIAQGLGPAGAYQTGGVDNVNLMNGGLTLTIPLGGGAGQRGAASAQMLLVMNSKSFSVSSGQWTGSAITFQVVNPQRIAQVFAAGSQAPWATFSSQTGMANGAGVAWGPSIGVLGISVAATYSSCVDLH